MTQSERELLAFTRAAYRAKDDQAVSIGFEVMCLSFLEREHELMRLGLVSRFVEPASFTNGLGMNHVFGQYKEIR